MQCGAVFSQKEGIFAAVKAVKGMRRLEGGEILVPGQHVFPCGNEPSPRLQDPGNLPAEKRQRARMMEDLAAIDEIEFTVLKWETFPPTGLDANFQAGIPGETPDGFRTDLGARVGLESGSFPAGPRERIRGDPTSRAKIQSPPLSRGKPFRCGTPFRPLKKPFGGFLQGIIVETGFHEVRVFGPSLEPFDGFLP